MNRSTRRYFIHSAVLMMVGAAPSYATGPLLIYSEIPGAESNLIPGALDIAGQPVTAHWTAIGGLAVRVQADEWVVRGFTDLGDDLLWTTVRGAGRSGATFMQEGQPVEGDASGDVWNAFVDLPPVSWNIKGLMGYSARARGGVTTDDEKIGTFDGTSHTIVLQQSSPIVPLPGTACPGALVGNSIGSVHMLDNGEVAFGNTPITNCSSFNYPGLFHHNVAIMQNGVAQITAGQVGTEFVESFSYDGAAFSADGLHFVLPVTTNNPNAAADRVLLADTTAVMREGQTVTALSTVIMADVFNVNYGGDGSVYIRGDDPADNDWCVRDGTFITATGMPITPGNFENWGNAIGTFTGNSNGDYIISGNTSNTDVNLDTVIVLNSAVAPEGGTPQPAQVLVREGDPVDVDGDGLFDDDTFIRTFTAGSVWLTDDDVLYFVGSLRNAALANLGDAFLRMSLNACPANIITAGASSIRVDVDDLLAVINNWGPCPAPPASCPANIVNTGMSMNRVDVDDLLAVISGWGLCP